jgi:hypothetical protein
VKLVRTTSRSRLIEAFGSAIGSGGIMRAEALSSGAASSDAPFPPLQPQLLDEQPQLGSQQQEASQQQLASQQPQPW